MTESDFPTERVCKLEDDIRKELQTESTFLKEDVKEELTSVKDGLMGVRSDFALAKQERQEDTLKLRKTIEKTTVASQEMINEKIAEIGQKFEELKIERSGPKTFLPRPNLPPNVPQFTGRAEECDEIVNHLSSESTRLSATIEAGRLHSSSPDEDDLCLSFNRLSNPCVIILDNADDLLECGEPNVKEDVIHLIGEILNRSDKVKFLLTTRESLSFLNLHFQGHMSVRIRELDQLSSQILTRELLPEASTSDLTKVLQICGQVPLAIKLLCSSISQQSSARSSQYVNEEFMESTNNIIEMLDNPDYPSNLRLKSLFDSAFKRLSTQEQEALVCLSILPAHFDLKIAAAVLGITRTTEAEKVLRRLQRKSLIDCCSDFDKFTIHKLLQSFAKEKGETEMKETVLTSKSRFYSFYISLFEKLNGNFLTGRSMSAFIEFYEDEPTIVQSLIDGCLDPRTADRVFDVLAKAELFLDSLFWSEGAKFERIFDSAIIAASQSGKKVFYRRLLNSRAFGEVTWVTSGNTKRLLTESKELQASTSSDCYAEKGTNLCYFGIHQLVMGKTDDGMKALQEALPFMSTSPEHTILKLIIFQIFAVYYHCKNDSVSSSKFCVKALKECRDARDTCLLVIPSIETAPTKGGQQNPLRRETNPLVNQPLEIEVIFLVSEAVKKFSSTETNQFFGNLLLRILKDSETALPPSTPGWFHFLRNAVHLLKSLNKYDDAITLTEERISFHRKALQQSMEGEEDIKENPEQHEEALAQNYLDLAAIHHKRGNYSEALESDRRALEIRLKLFGKEHLKTAESYHSVGVTQLSMGNYIPALVSENRALDIRLKLLGEDHPETGDSFRSVGVIQHILGDYISALESKKRALDIRVKTFGEEHSSTADSYHSVGVTLDSLGDYISALESKKRALDIRRKLFGEEHPKTADSYYSVGVTQDSLKRLHIRP
ncbi:hypothetical protein ACROYT_G044034 [Oculina patagonica]